MTPFKITCDECGVVLWESETEMPGQRYVTVRNSKYTEQPSPIETFMKNVVGSRCWNCGKKISLKPINCDVKPLK